MLDDDDSMFQHLQVGGPYTERVWWPEGVHLWMDSTGIRVGIFVANPDPREITDVEKGTAQFGWTTTQYNGFLLCKYGQGSWNDAPFNPQRLTEPFDMAPLERGQHRPVYTFLVHADTGIIAAMRMFTWPAYFVSRIVAAVRRLDAAEYGEPEARADQQDFYRRYPNGPSLYRLASTLPAKARCTGGQATDEPDKGSRT